jgi:Tfp pilus assembly protein PilV
VLIEVLVSAVVLVIASAGVFTLLATTVSTQAEQRHSSEAYALAQEDQARLASMRLSVLNHMDETRTVTLNQTEFKVRSLGLFVNDTTSTASCGSGTSTADYVQTTSLVSWPGMKGSEKAKIESIVSPSNGSLDANNGTLAVAATNELMEPMPNVFAQIGGLSGSTNAQGCVTFPDLPGGTYIMNVSAEAAGLVNKNGQRTEVKEVSAVSADTKNVALLFDRPGTIPVKFKARIGSSVNFEPAKADAVIANNTGMKEARVFGIAGGTRGETVEATSLFPFSSAYTLYAGSCASNDPGEGPAKVNAVAPRGSAATPAPTIQLPALELIVKNGATALSGAKVTLTDTVCKDALGNFVKRTYTTNGEGKPSGSTGVAEPGVPWGVYNVCVSANISGSDRRKKVPEKAVKSLTSATSVPVDLSSGYESGACP